MIYQYKNNFAWCEIIKHYFNRDLEVIDNFKKKSLPILIVCLFLSLTACQSNETAYYDKLCNIYSSIVNRPISTSDKEGLLAEQIKNDMPDFYNENYLNIMTIPLTERYSFIKRIAEEVSGKNWECPVIRDYGLGKYEDSQ